MTQVLKGLGLEQHDGDDHSPLLGPAGGARTVQTLTEHSSLCLLVLQCGGDVSGGEVVAMRM